MEPYRPADMELSVGARWRNGVGGVSHASQGMMSVRLSADGMHIRPATRLLPLLSLDLAWASIDRLEDARWGVRVISNGKPVAVLLTWPGRLRKQVIFDFARRMGITVEMNAKRLSMFGL
jgi:hypothetical protein